MKLYECHWQPLLEAVSFFFRKLQLITSSYVTLKTDQIFKSKNKNTSSTSNHAKMVFIIYRICTYLEGGGAIQIEECVIL